MKKELLAPAGDIESFYAAVHAGADAIYLGGEKFGARKFAPNFSREELKKVVEVAHLYGVKIYVTVNTMIYEEEMASLLEYVSYLYSIGVDALIIQDIGLIRLIRKNIPDMELHASTQLHNYQETSFSLLEELGVKRVVLARENTLEEIKNIHTPLEKEVFIHGAICISYSGQCLFSSLILNRSGNRGECAGMCRLPYSLEDKDGKEIEKSSYLLSPKELCTISRFRELMESDITSFKIEGRMKSPTYVYLVTKIYRTLINQYMRGDAMVISDEMIEKLKTIFNRGFTTGHLFSDTDDFMSFTSANHLGVSLGNAEVKGKKIRIFLEKELYQEDGIRFVSNGRGMIVNFLYDKDDKLISYAPANSYVFVDNKVGLTGKSQVLKTSSKRLDEEILSYPKRKVELSCLFTAKNGEEISLLLKDDMGHEVKSFGKIPDFALKRATTSSEVEENLRRMGDTIYSFSSLQIEMEEGLFIPKSAINSLRREAVTLMNEARIDIKKVASLQKIEDKYEEKIKKPVKISCLVRTEEQLLASLPLVDRVYVTNYSLYQKYKDTNPSLYFRVDRGCNSLNYEGERLLLTEFAQLHLAKNNTVVSDYYLNVANLSYLTFLKENGVLCSTLSSEAKKEQVLKLVPFFDTEVIVYGNLELMLIKNVPALSTFSGSYLKDRMGKKYFVNEENGYIHLFSYQKEWYREEEISSFVEQGLSFIRLEFLEEKKDEILEIIKKYQELYQK